jgi:hypothetical protein
LGLDDRLLQWLLTKPDFNKRTCLFLRLCLTQQPSFHTTFQRVKVVLCCLPLVVIPFIAVAGITLGVFGACAPRHNLTGINLAL